MEMYANNNVCSTAACTASGGVGDVETNYDNAMSNANSQMPNPGNGTNATGDTPQEVLFIVTDGVEDEMNGGIRLIQQINGGTSTNYCTTIKGRGIKIAILYTEYLPVPVELVLCQQRRAVPVANRPGAASLRLARPVLRRRDRRRPRPGALDPVPGRRAGRQPDAVSAWHFGMFVRAGNPPSVTLGINAHEFGRALAA